MGEDNPKVFGGRRSFAVLDEEEIFALARKIVEDEKHFLDPGLTMESLAEELNVHHNALSGAVNRFSGVAFPIGVGMYRIAEVERLAALPENHGCGTAKLALMSGFSNRKSFHRVYTSLRGGKPSETLPGRKNKSVQGKLKISKVKPMRKILLTLLVSALLCAGAFAQGGTFAQSAATSAAARLSRNMFFTVPHAVPVSSGAAFWCRRPSRTAPKPTLENQTNILTLIKNEK